MAPFSHPDSAASNNEDLTHLPGAGRISKADEIFDALGDLDELNAALGALKIRLPDPILAGRTESIQLDVQRIAAEIAAGASGLAPDALDRLASWQADLEAGLPPLHGFVLPGATESSARAHLARTVCRRAERSLVRTAQTHPGRIPATARAYLNRLSGWLFALARKLESAPAGSVPPMNG